MTTSHRPGSSSERQLETGLGMIVLVGPLLWGVSVAFHDPYTHLGAPCLFRELTGLACPGCGCTRALYSLLTGDGARVMNMNAGLPIFVALWLWCSAQLLLPRFPVSYRASQAITISLAGVLGVFAVLRNLPWWPWGLPPS